MSDHQEQLAWRAACYLLGELRADEAAAFEAELAASQSAREALARAVELEQAALAALAQPAVETAAAAQLVTPVRRIAGGFRQQWLVVCGSFAAAALAVAVWLGVVPGRFNPAVDGELAAAWSEVSLSAAEEAAGVSEEGAGVLAEPAAPAELSPEAAPLAAVAVADAEGAALNEAPSWMTAAVLGIAGRQEQTPERREN